MSKKLDLAGLKEYDKGVKDALTKKADKETVDNLETEVSTLSTKVSGLENNVVDHTHVLADITNLFIGTQVEYETAYKNGLIPVGALVIITDDCDDEDESSILGVGVLGAMILGQ